MYPMGREHSHGGVLLSERINRTHSNSMKRQGPSRKISTDIGLRRNTCLGKSIELEKASMWMVRNTANGSSMNRNGP